jgi:hypothetical protein
VKPSHPDKIDFEAPTSVVLALPTKAWGGLVWRNKIGRTANVIESASDSAKRLRYLTNAVEVLSTELRDMGATDSDIFAEMGKFRAAMYCELGRRRALIRQGPGAA